MITEILYSPLTLLAWGWSKVRRWIEAWDERRHPKTIMERKKTAWGSAGDAAEEAEDVEDEEMIGV